MSSGSVSRLVSLADAVAGVRFPAWAAVPDAELLELVRTAGMLKARADALVATLAGQVAVRSSREAGYSGLAQRHGAKSADRLVQKLTGVSDLEARALTTVGKLDEQSPITAAVAGGSLTVGQAAAISTGLGVPNGIVPDSALAAAAADLAATGTELSVEELRIQAKATRDDLDATSVEDREKALRERRYLRLISQEDGMTRITGLLDPLSAAQVAAVVDAGTAPRRGGPRFTTPTGRDRAARLVADERSIPQIALDTVVAVLKAGAAADLSLLGPVGAPVQVLITEPALTTTVSRPGADAVDSPAFATGSANRSARILGQSTPISASTAQARVCSDGVSPIRFDGFGRRVLDLGRTQRLFSPRQRAVIAARDGGCRMPGCTAPPGWCETHHIVPWSCGGNTDVDDGILLCRFHHLMLHNNGWAITRDAEHRYWATPPDTIDPERRPIELPSRNPLLTRNTA